MNEYINICYVDDRIDLILNQYLDEYCNTYNTQDENYKLRFSEYKFNNTDNYKTLLDNKLINDANILVIDSRLFENESSSLSKLTGEQFKVILRQIFPFIKTIVISQNPIKLDSVSISKFKSGESSGERYDAYYDRVLKSLLDSYVKATIEEFQILKQLATEEEVDSVLISTIESTISGIQDTALFEKEDLDKLINAFNEVKIRHDN